MLTISTEKNNLFRPRRFNYFLEIYRFLRSIYFPLFCLRRSIGKSTRNNIKITPCRDKSTRNSITLTTFNGLNSYAALAMFGSFEIKFRAFRQCNGGRPHWVAGFACGIGFGASLVCQEAPLPEAGPTLRCMS